MTEEAKKKLAAALITLGICTAATACGYVDNLSPAQVAKLKPAITNFNRTASVGTVVGGFAASVRPTVAEEVTAKLK